jgi:hypothetical protein
VAVSVIVCPVNGVGLLAASVHDGAAVGGGCQFTSVFAGAPAPDGFAATSVYCFAPGAPTLSWQVEVVLVQPVHENVVGLPEQVAVIVIVEPAIGVKLLGESVHTGTVGAAQITKTVLTAPVPNVFVP